MKAIRQSHTRDILDAYEKEDISYSRMNEMFNELADEFAIGFAEFLKKEGYVIELIKGSRATNKLLEIYKKEKGL